MARQALIWWLAVLGLACASTASNWSGPTYASDATAGGVTGGPDAEALDSAVTRVLRERGDKPEADGRLAAAAGWFLDEIVAGRSPSTAAIEEVARRRGFVGPLAGIEVFPLEPPSDSWRQSIALAPRNQPINRYGLVVSKDQRAASLILGVVELELDPFPAQVMIGEKLRLRGKIAGRFRNADVHVTAPDGTVRSTPAPARKFDVLVELAAKGTYMVEVMGDGATGPVILANVPVVVGTRESGARSRPEGIVVGALPPPEVVEQQMHTLLNQARVAAGLKGLALDPELRKVALAHSRDMASGNFVGHVSPTTGSPEDRLRRAGVTLMQAGENVAQGDSAESAHDGLMESPGHRANMLNSKYTHVGIGVVLTPQGMPLVATLVFGRRPSVPAAKLTASEVLRAVAGLRRARGLPALPGDPVLRAAAEAGAKAFASGSASTPARAIAVSNQLSEQETRRLRISRPAGCAAWVEIVELEQLGEHPLFFERGLSKLDLGVAPKPGDTLGALAMVVLTEGGRCDTR